MNAYRMNGYASRTEYLEGLCEEYPHSFVYALADLFGPDEDFDGLITALEDAAQDMYEG